MIEVSLDVCGHYSYTKDFEIIKEEEREWSAKDREREGSVFSDSESLKKSLIFLKPSLSIYSIPLGLGLNYMALK